ncbi:gas vesicle protein GvpO [Streptomyces sp. NPDC006333]
MTAGVVVGLPRIPDTTSLLAEVQIGQDGEPLEYSKARRYRRGSGDD